MFKLLPGMFYVVCVYCHFLLSWPVATLYNSCAICIKTSPVCAQTPQLETRVIAVNTPCPQKTPQFVFWQYLHQIFTKTVPDFEFWPIRSWNIGKYWDHGDMDKVPTGYFFWWTWCIYQPVLNCGESKLK